MPSVDGATGISSNRRCQIPQSPGVSLRAWWERLSSHPDREFAKYVLSGLEHGFRIRFDYKTRLSSARQNMPSAAEHPEVVVRYITDERTTGRILGPVGKEQLPGLQVNRFGVIPKGWASNKLRLITDLSFPDGGSVNDGVSPKLCSFQYTSVDRVARAAHRLGPGALLAKADIEAAYRLVPVHPEDRPLLRMQWQGQYFIDARLPFGLRSTPIGIIIDGGGGRARIVCPPVRGSRDRSLPGRFYNRCTARVAYVPSPTRSIRRGVHGGGGDPRA